MFNFSQNSQNFFQESVLLSFCKNIVTNCLLQRLSALRGSIILQHFSKGNSKAIWYSFRVAFWEMLEYDAAAHIYILKLFDIASLDASWLLRIYRNAAASQVEKFVKSERVVMLYINFNCNLILSKGRSCWLRKPPQKSASYRTSYITSLHS